MIFAHTSNLCPTYGHHPNTTRAPPPKFKLHRRPVGPRTFVTNTLSAVGLMSIVKHLASASIAKHQRASLGYLSVRTARSRRRGSGAPPPPAPPRLDESVWSSYATVAYACGSDLSRIARRLAHKSAVVCARGTGGRLGGGDCNARQHRQHLHTHALVRGWKRGRELERVQGFALGCEGR